MGPDQFEMHHPESGGTAATTEQQFAEVWEPRGWVRSEVVVPDATEAPVADVDPQPEAAPPAAKPAKRGSETRT